MNDLDLLKSALEHYINKWDGKVSELRCEMPDQNVILEVVKLNSMRYLAQWIVNSINGGLDKVHATNICNVILDGKND